MLEKEKCDLSRYRLQRAKELIIDAESLFERESYKSSNNRAYYAVFSCMRAVLALDGEDFKKHSGVIQYFQRTYIKTGWCFGNPLPFWVCGHGEYSSPVSQFDSTC